jgi:hypothetical protein
MKMLTDMVQMAQIRDKVRLNRSLLTPTNDL